MPIKTPTLKPAKKMVVHTVSTPLPYAHYQRCTQCDMLFRLPVLKRNQSAWCPRCNAKVRDGRDWSLTRLGSMALAMLLLMPFAWSEPLLRLHLLGVRIDANVLQGILADDRAGRSDYRRHGAVLRGGRPGAAGGLHQLSLAGQCAGMNLRPVLLMLGKLKEWVMLDIYLVGIGVASIKVQDYAFLQPGIGLVAFISLTLLSILTLIHMNVEELWERSIPSVRRPAPIIICRSAPAAITPAIATRAAAADAATRRCIIADRRACSAAGRRRLPRWFSSFRPTCCQSPSSTSTARARTTRSSRGLFPGQQQYRHCRGRVYRQYFGAIHQSYSVIYPAAQHTIQVRAGIAHPHPAAAANHLIGRWSMLDLFVISLTMSLINRDQLLAFTMGPAAVYFGGAVILTILAVEWLDSRLLWDAHESGNARFAD